MKISLEMRVQLYLFPYISDTLSIVGVPIGGTPCIGPVRHLLHVGNRADIVSTVEAHVWYPSKGLSKSKYRS